MDNNDKIIFTPLERKEAKFTPLDRKSYPYKSFQNDEAVIQYARENVERARQKSISSTPVELTPNLKESKKIDVKTIIKRVLAGILVVSGLAAGISFAIPVIKKQVVKNEERKRVETKIESQGFDARKESEINYDKLSLEEEDLYGAYLSGLDLNEMVQTLGYENTSDFLIKKGMVEVYSSGVSHPSTRVWENYEEADLLKAQEREVQNGKSR